MEKWIQFYERYFPTRAEVGAFVTALESLELHDPRHRAKIMMHHGGMLVCGTGLFYRKAWARKGALIVLVAAAIYGGNAFAWGYAREAPNAEALMIGYGAMILWNLVWFYLIYRETSAEVLR